MDAALLRIAGEPKRRTAGHWVKRLAKGTQQLVLDGLVTAEILEVERTTVMGFIPRTRYPWVNGTEPAAAEARERMRAAILGASADPRTSALCSLIAAVEIDRKLFADLDRRQVRQRLKEISEGAWAATAVRKAIQEVQAAVMAAAVAGAVAAGSG